MYLNEFGGITRNKTPVKFEAVEAKIPMTSFGQALKHWLLLYVSHNAAQQHILLAVFVVTNAEYC